MKLYTGTGDTGDTKAFSGETYRKNDSIIEANGAIDETMVAIEQLRIHLLDNEEHLKTINKIHEALGLMGAEISSGKTTVLNKFIVTGFVDRLEVQIDELYVPLKEFQNFYKQSSIHCNEARVRVRKLERTLTNLLRQKRIRPVIYIYLNRLSDYLFALAVHLEKQKDGTQQ